MKIRDGYVLRSVMDQHMVMPIDDTVSRGYIILNDTGAVLWAALQQPCDRTELVQQLLQQYHAEQSQAEKAVDLFLDQLRRLQLLQEG